MSSTNRGAQRIDADYYVTPVDEIERFLMEWQRDEGDAAVALRTSPILDPCAGGNILPVEWEYKPGRIMTIPSTKMSYPAAIRNVLGVAGGGVGDGPTIWTNDIREDSPAEAHVDFVSGKLPWKTPPGIVMTNPPFSRALDIIKRSFSVVNTDGGFIVMLLRLNFFGSAARFPFFTDPHGYAPLKAYVHHKRMSFTPDGKADSIEYCHMVWRKGTHNMQTLLRVI